MSKKSKAANKELRLQKKRAIKAANKAKYAAWANQGQNSKTNKRKSSSSKAQQKLKGTHLAFRFCGNPACRVCFHKDELGNLFQIRYNLSR